MLFSMLLPRLAIVTAAVAAAAEVSNAAPQQPQAVVANTEQIWDYDYCVGVLRNESAAGWRRQAVLDRAENAHNPLEEFSQTLQLTITLDWYPQYEQSKRDRLWELLTDSQVQAVENLERLADEQQHFNAAYLLGELYLYGNYSMPRNPAKAVHYLEQAAKVKPEEGNAAFSQVHYLLGFIYATGLYGEVEQNHGKSLLHLTMAADMGHIRAAMCLAYRYHVGMTVEKNEDLALYYYTRVARHCREVYSLDSEIQINATLLGSSIPQPLLLGPNIDTYNVRLSDFADGLYGADVSQVQLGIRKDLDKMQSSFRGSVDGTVGGVPVEILGKAFSSSLDDLDADPTEHHFAELYRSFWYNYHGDYLQRRNYTRAFRRALQCVQEGMQLPSVHYYEKYSRMDRTLEVEVTARCAASVGHMYLRGEGVAQNFTSARRWLQRSLDFFDNGDASADLGLIYQFGLGLERPDLQRAKKIYKGAFRSHATSYQYGLLLLAENDPLGWRFVSMAAYEHYPPAMYAVLQAYTNGNLFGVNKQFAISSAKLFAEYVEPAVSDLKWGFSRAIQGDAERALLAYGMAADAGYESAQASVGYLLYPPTGYLEDKPNVPLDRFKSAVHFYRESARQGNLDSMVFLGDLYLRGMQNASSTEEDYLIAPNPEKAVGIYREASNKYSHQASFFLGHAYETGHGVPRDLHLAKRYYDKALSIKPDAYLPVQLALLRLRVKKWWFRLTGVKVTESSEEEDQGLPRRTWHELLRLHEMLRAKQNEPTTAINVSPEGETLDEGTNSREASRRRETTAQDPPDEEYEADGELGLEDLIFTGVFLSFILFAMYSRWRAARRRRENREGNANGEANAGNEQPRPPAFQFNFMVIPL